MRSLRNVSGNLVEVGEFKRAIVSGESLENAAARAGLHEWELLGYHTKQLRSLFKQEEYQMSDVDDAYVKANEAIGRAKEAYERTVQGFRSTIKNDLASISSSANRVQAEAIKMQQAYVNAMSTLCGTEMERAILNAERLAKALESISALQSHSITFAVLDKKPAP